MHYAVERYSWCAPEYVELEKSLPYGPSKDLTWDEFWNSINLDMHIYGTSLIWKAPNAFGNIVEVKRLDVRCAIPQSATPDYPNGYYRIDCGYPIGQCDRLESCLIPSQHISCIKKQKRKIPMKAASIGYAILAKVPDHVSFSNEEIMESIRSNDLQGMVRRRLNPLYPRDPNGGSDAVFEKSVANTFDAVLDGIGDVLSYFTPIKCIIHESGQREETKSGPPPENIPFTDCYGEKALRWGLNESGHFYASMESLATVGSSCNPSESQKKIEVLEEEKKEESWRDRPSML